MAAQRMRISEGATREGLLALLSKLTRQLRALTPPGEDASRLDAIEAELAWQSQLDTWFTSAPKQRCAICCGSDQYH
jgi:hypothetical protein